MSQNQMVIPPMCANRNRARGFSFIEVLVVLAVIGTLAILGVLGFRNFVDHEALETATHDLYTMLSDARSATLASEYGEQYGVRIDCHRLTRFRGAAYNPADPFNQVILLPVICATATLSGGPTIVFQKQTGTTTNSGTIKLIHQRSLASTTMTLYSSGIVSTP